MSKSAIGQLKPPSRVAQGRLKLPSTIQTHIQKSDPYKEGYLNLKGRGYRGEIAR